MASLRITSAEIPSQKGKTAIITGEYLSQPFLHNLCQFDMVTDTLRDQSTGGSSGIGYAAARLLAEREASVHIIDVNPPEEDVSNIRFHKCDITKWSELRAIFQEVGHIDYAFANAGVSEETNYFADQFDSDGLLVEPTYAVLDVNLRGVYNVIKLAWSQMRADKTHGSIVITTSATAYSPEQSLPVYSSGKLAVSTQSGWNMQPRAKYPHETTVTKRLSFRFSLSDSSGRYARA